MKYINKFSTTADYQAFTDGDRYVTPNICYVEEAKGVVMKPYIAPKIPISLGDVAYWNGSSIKTTPYSKWSTSLGTPVGVVVIPEGFAPDGKARIVSLKYVDSNGNPSVTRKSMKWGPYGTDTPLTNYNRVPTTDNAGSTSTSSNGYGYLPSDKFSGNQSFVDPEAYYDTFSSIPYSPSPYLEDGPNPEYYKTISGYNNAFSDFNGLSNTQTLVGLGLDYVAANAAWKYKDGVSNLQWYLPAMGELGYIMARLNLINESLTAVGGVSYDILFLCSSTERNKNDVWFLSSSPYDYSEVPNWYKDITHDVRPFALLDNNGGGTSLITFTIAGVQYQAEEGMTWEEWCNSEYNTYGYFIEHETVYSKWYVELIDDVNPSDIILNNGVYLTKPGGAGSA